MGNIPGCPFPLRKIVPLRTIGANAPLLAQNIHRQAIAPYAVNRWPSAVNCQPI
jgi:hypothetical protein